MSRETAARTSERGILLSIVVPMFNEADNVEPFLGRVEKVAESIVAPLDDR